MENCQNASASHNRARRATRCTNVHNIRLGYQARPVGTAVRGRGDTSVERGVEWAEWNTPRRLSVRSQSATRRRKAERDAARPPWRAATGTMRRSAVLRVAATGGGHDSRRTQTPALDTRARSRPLWKAIAHASLPVKGGIIRARIAETDAIGGAGTPPIETDGRNGRRTMPGQSSAAASRRCRGHEGRLLR